MKFVGETIHLVARKANSASGGRLVRIYQLYLAGDREFENFTLYVPPSRADRISTDIEDFILSNASGRVFWDIGANIGYLSLQAASVAKVVRAFEPDPSNSQILTENVERNDFTNIQTHQIAISEEDATAEFFSDREEGSGIQSLAYDERLGGETLSVDTRTIDSLADEYGDPGFVKVDVEGAEEQVLRGAIEVLERGNTDWLIEVHASETGERVDRISQHGGSADELYGLLEDHEYHIYGYEPEEDTTTRLDRDDSPRPLYWFATTE